MRHIRELVALAKAVHPRDRFFANLDQTLAFSELRADYRAYERALSLLDPESWAELRAKAIAHFSDHRPGQLKQGFFNQLNEAFAYQYLVRCGYRQVRTLAGVASLPCSRRSMRTLDPELRKSGSWE